MRLRRRKALVLSTIFLFSVLVSPFAVSITSAATTGTVTATSLNIREKASTSAKIVGTLSKGTSVTIENTIKDKEGTNWYYISTKLDKQTVRGYVAAKYIESTSKTVSSSESSSSFVERVGYVNETYLNVRKSASASSKRLGVIKEDQKVIVLKKVKSGSSYWYKISTLINSKKVTGYVSTKYITLEKTTAKDTMEKLGSIKSNGIYLYKTANKKDVILCTLNKGKEVISLATIKAGGNDWTKVKVKHGDKKLTGYVLSSAVKNITATASNKDATLGEITVKTHLRTIGSSLSSSKGLLQAGTDLTITNTITVNKKKWNKCKVVIDGKKVTGYVLASKSATEKELDFLEDLEAFPTSYHSSLKKLHEKYPNWSFKAEKIDTKWNDAVALQSFGGKNTLASLAATGGSSGSNSAPLSYLSKDPDVYDKETNTYKMIADPMQYSIIDSVVAYYMDPRNFLTEKHIFMFENVKKTASEDQVETVLSKTFMNGRFRVFDTITGEGISKKYLDVFLSAGKDHKISAAFLAARSKQMLTLEGNQLSSGTNSKYKGYYNFLNIGSYDKSTKTYSYDKSLSYASSGTSYLRPWSNPENSILGGAKYLAKNYVNKGQNTIYFQKYNFVNGTAGTNQYTTNVKAPLEEANSLYLSYRDTDTLAEERTFYIPVYKRMTTDVCELP